MYICTYSYMANFLTIEKGPCQVGEHTVLLHLVLTAPFLVTRSTLTHINGHPEAEFLDEIQTKVFRVFLLAIHSHLYSFALRFLFFFFFKLTQPLKIFTDQLLYKVKEKGGKIDRKLYPLPYLNLYRNLKSENSQDYAQKPQRNCTFMNSASVLVYVYFTQRTNRIDNSIII
jgi:hypothetical protein